MGPLVVNAAEGPLILTDGGELSTLNVALGPAAGAELQVPSSAVPAVMEMPRVPSPEMLSTVTVRVVLPEPDTVTTPFALPVLFTVMSDGDNVTFVAPVLLRRGELAGPDAASCGARVALLIDIVVAVTQV